ncbi:MAG: adenosylcobinamide-GDP ribazoletransferase [Pseudomonadota bacterium]
MTHKPQQAKSDARWEANPLFDLAAALGLLTRLPIRVDGDRALARGARAAWAYPVVGGLVGALGAVAGLAALAVGLPPTLAALAILGTTIALTGALHEDGLADTADGFWGGYTPERRLEIMGDSRIGTYGVLALGLSLIARWAALSALLTAGPVFALLVATGTLSRLPMVWLMQTLPPARKGGLSSAAGKPGILACIAATLIAILAGFWTGQAFVLEFALLALFALGIGAIANAKIGGQTGDVLGASQQVTEIVLLCALLIALPSQ